MTTIDNNVSVSSQVPPRFSGRDFTSSDYREVIDELLRRTDERFRYGLRYEGTYPFAEFFGCFSFQFYIKPQLGLKFREAT